MKSFRYDCENSSSSNSTSSSGDLHSNQTHYKGEHFGKTCTPLTSKYSYINKVSKALRTSSDANQL
jgi:hypothetical protein